MPARKHLVRPQGAGPPQITTSSVPDASVGQAYSAPLSAIGGVPPYTWSGTITPNTGGALSVAATGVIRGTPSSAEAETVALTVTDRNGVRGQRSIGLTVDATAPIWASLPPIQFTQGTAGSINLNSFCTDPQGLTLNFSLISGSFPAGVSFLSPLLSYNGSGAVGSDSGVAFSASNGVASSNSAATSVSVVAGSQPGALPSLTLMPSQTTASGAWTFGHAFRQGDVPAGNFIAASSGLASGQQLQAQIRKRLPDGS